MTVQYARSGAGAAASAPVAANHMKKTIEQIAVLGAGTMGARIAAHFANAGVQCSLLDIPGNGADAPPAERNRPASAGLAAAVSARPAAFFTPETARLVRTGNFEDNLDWCAEADWILEAVVENLEIKRSLLERVDQHRRSGTFVTTNTSGLPVARIAEGRSADFLAHWAGTHFFNPPRYLKLVEIIPGPSTRPEVLETLSRFSDERLGKGVVFAKDTPNFIANRVGTFAVLTVLGLAADLEMTVEEIDALTGPALGRPRSATFRTADIVGIDVLAHVVRNLYDNLPGDESRELFRVPKVVGELVERGWLGEKSGKGFYQRVKRDGESEILTLDWRAMDYRPRQRAKLPALDAAKLVTDTGERLRALLAPALEGKASDKAAKFLWGAISRPCLYAASRVPEIADTLVDVDRAMRWGFGWELGPFETWDAVGLEPMARALEREGNALPPIVEKALKAGRRSFYQSAEGRRSYFDLGAGAMKPVPEPEGILILKSLRERSKTVEHNSGASLVDLGDGVVCCEFHTKMNALGGDIFAMLQKGVHRLESDFDAMVVANQGEHFSAGANLMLLLVAAQEQDWDEIDLAVRQFQRVTQAIRYAPKPVVVAPHGMTLGGGCEISLHGARRHAAAETYMGLVETGVGLIPAGGGCKEMLARANTAAAAGSGLDLFQHLRPIFETIAMAKVSTSAEEARKLGYLDASDPVAMNGDRLVAQAKQTALALARSGYRPPTPPAIRVLGEEFLTAARLAIHMMLRAEYITEYDAVVARKLAHILAGGALSSPQTVSESYILDLEREAFVSLTGERKTQERIAHTLKTGKPLRN
jgi:3-hydroxyacyl-CoA dehydrogenase